MLTLAFQIKGRFVWSTKFSNAYFSIAILTYATLTLAYTCQIAGGNAVAGIGWHCRLPTAKTWTAMTANGKRLKRWQTRVFVDIW